MRAHVQRIVSFASLATTAACSLLSTDNLQTGSSGDGGTAASTGAVATDVTSGSDATSAVGPTTTSSSGGGAGGNGAGGEASSAGGGPSTTANTGGGSTTGSSSSGGGGAGVGPCGEPPEYANAVLASAPVAYFRFGGDDESLLVNEVGTGDLVAAPTNIESVESDLETLGCALHPQTTQAEVAWTPVDATLLDETRDFSFELWLTATELPPTGDTATILGHQFQNGSSRLEVNLQDAGAIYWVLLRSNQPSQVGSFDGVVGQGLPTYIVVTRAYRPPGGEGGGDPGGDDLEIFINTISVATGHPESTPSLRTDANRPITVPGGYWPPAAGRFDELAIYDRVLADDEIVAHYCAAMTGPCP